MASRQTMTHLTTHVTARHRAMLDRLVDVVGSHPPTVSETLEILIEEEHARQFGETIRVGAALAP